MAVTEERHQALTESGINAELPPVIGSPILSSIGPKLLLFLLLLLLPAGFASPVFAIEFNALWQYRQSGGDDLDTQRDFLQRYSLGVGQTITYRPSHAISASAAVGYSNAQADSGDGFRSRDQLSPSARVALHNDIFQSQLSGTVTQENITTSGESNKSDLWDWSIGSTWFIPFIPQLSYNYGEANESHGFNETNSNFTVSWDLLLAQLYYRYGTNTSKGDTRRAETDFQSFQLESNGRLWHDRLTYNFSQRFFQTTQNTKITESEDGSFEFPLEGQTASAVTDPVTGPDPEDVILDPNPQLNDGDLETVALVVPPDERANLGISLEFGEDISAIHLTLDPLTTLTEDQALAMQWSLYVRDPFDTAWELESAEVPFTYDSAEKQFSLLIDLFNDEIMVVAINLADIPLDFTELEVFSLLLEEDTSSETTGYTTNLGMSVQLSQTLRASGNLVLDHSDRDLQGSGKANTDQRTVSGNLQWNPHPSVRPSLSGSENRYEGPTGSEEISRVYSLNVATYPLPSLTVTFNTTYNERYIDDQKTFSGTRSSLTSKALLYPDLTADWNLSYRDQDTRRADDSNSNTNGISSRLSLNARLYRKLFADIITNYTNTETEPGTNQNADASLSLRYRPSDLLALRGTYRTYFLDSQNDDRLNLVLTLTLLNTYKTSLVFGATHSKRGSTSSSNFGLNWNWDISRNLALISNGSYTTNESRDTYNFLVNLTFRL